MKLRESQVTIGSGRQQMNRILVLVVLCPALWNLSCTQKEDVTACDSLPAMRAVATFHFSLLEHVALGEREIVRKVTTPENELSLDQLKQVLAWRDARTGSTGPRRTAFTG